MVKESIRTIFPQLRDDIRVGGVKLSGEGYTRRGVFGQRVRRGQRLSDG